MSEEFLASSLTGSLTPDVQCPRFNIADDWFNEAKLIELRLRQYRQNSEYANWGLWAIVKVEASEMVGHIGFHATPNADYLADYAKNAVEIGFSVYPQHRLHGIATEAARGLIEWASREMGARRFVVSIAPDNDPSIQIARRLGFSRIGEWQDPDDGLEFVFLLESAAIL